MKEIEKWFRDKGDLTHRVNYELTENSVVFDVGAFQGKFIESIYRKYKCNIHAFEPVNQFAKILQLQWSNVEKVKIYNFALGTISGTLDICIDGDASSTHVFNGKNLEKIQIHKIDDVIKQLNISKIDLIKINIEGEEYPLLDYCLDNKLTNDMQNIQVQFHDFIPNAVERRRSIRDRLSKTHEVTYEYEFIWENWKKK